MTAVFLKQLTTMGQLGKVVTSFKLYSGRFNIIDIDSIFYHYTPEALPKAAFQ